MISVARALSCVLLAALWFSPATSAAGAGISGTVTDAATLTGVAGVSVSVYDVGGNVVGAATTGFDGTYTTGPLGAGPYRVGFAAPGYQSQFFRNRSSLGTADQISVQPGAPTTGIDAELVALSAITGTVTDQRTHQAIQGAEVTAYDSSGSPVASASTGADGSYTVAGVPPGVYRVGFEASGYQSQFYSARTSLASADPVTLSSGYTMNGVDAALAPSPGSITGRVTDAVTGRPIRNVEVTVYDGQGAAVNTSCTAASGKYTIAGLVSGTYRVGFNDDCGATGYLPQFYSGQPSLAAANPVAVAAGSATSGIDAQVKLAPRGQPPANTSLPSLGGAATLGQRLSASAGEWSGTAPLAYGFQWQRCTQSCVEIPGASDSTYTSRVSDLGARLRVVVSATNGGGSASATSTPTGPVVPTLNQIKAQLLSQAVPSGQALSASTLLRDGGCSYTFSSLSPGRLAISWFQAPVSPYPTQDQTPPAPLASGQATFTAAGTAQVTTTLTEQGRLLLQDTREPTLEAQMTFTVSGGGSVTATRTFALPLPGPPTTPRAMEEFGANVNRLFNDRTYTTAQIAAQLQALRDTGATIARADALWEWAEPDRPVADVHRYDWSFDDQIVGSLAANGLRWLPIIDYAPPWAAADPGQLHSPPASPDDYASFAAALTARYGTGGSFWRSHPGLNAQPVRTYEIWNEPDTRNFWFPSPNPASYAAIYSAARDAIKTVDPTAQVIVGGLVLAEEFIPAMLRAQPALRGNIDGVAIHPYATTPQAVLARVQAARATLSSSGLRGLPLYITEFGWATEPVGAPNWASETVRPDYITETLSALGHSNCYVAASLIYTWVSPEQNPNSEEDWYGIFGPDGFSTPDTEAFAAGLREAELPQAPVGGCRGG